ncbi:tetratricopeptide repeat protein [Chryseolinea lacunae]|uniref:Tetratricopeptide repeat protein n=1 Tax=Chryseolinea lacunae TaxID=2801331 RepID=A0ABS1KN60_9BACT|nr:tetratricopeptide repeat protein [Chryseolinea lacunae]MBL0740780.1 tetratricopeptide repeat protein [Chryseolinea lacunae]
MEMLADAMREYMKTSTRLQTYDEVKVDWKMDGKTQLHMNEGLNNLAEGNPKVASEEFGAVLNAAPSVWQAFYYRAVCAKQLRKYGMAKWDIHQALRLHGPFYEGYVELGKIYRLESDQDEALEYFEKAIKLDPKRSMAYYLKANLKSKQQFRREAIKNYEAALEHDSLFSDAGIALAMLQVTSDKKVEQAVPYLDRVVRRDTLNRIALLLRTCMTFDSRPQQCLKDLNLLVKLWPTNLMVFYLRGLLYAKLEDYERSFPDFHKLVDNTAEDENTFGGQQSWIDKKIDIQNLGAYTVSRVYGFSDADAVLIKKAYCLLVKGEYADCIVAVDKATVAQTDPLSFYMKGVASEHLNKHPEALAYYNQALALDNDILDAHKKRGIYEQEMKQWDKSIADFKEMLRINPQAYVARKFLGLTFYHVKIYPKAVVEFNRYLSRDSADQVALGARGMAYWNLGLKLDAAADFANSENFQMLEFPEIARSIDSLLVRKDTVKALRYIERITTGAPFFTEGYVMMMKVLIAKNDWSRINKEIGEALSNSRADASHKDHAYLLTVKGVTWLKKEKYDYAFNLLTSALDYDKENSWTWLARGQTQLALNRKSKAVSDLKKAVALGNKEAETLLRQVGE